MFDTVRMDQLYGEHAINEAGKHFFPNDASQTVMINQSLQRAENYVLWGPTEAAGIVDCEQRFLQAAGFRSLPRPTVRALEVVVTAPEWASEFMQDKLFNDTLSWAWRYFGVPILSAVVHRHEGAPHLHMLLLPLVQGRMNGSAIYKEKIGSIDQAYNADVAAPNMASASYRWNDRERHAAVKQAFEVLHRGCGLEYSVLVDLLKPQIKDCLFLSNVRD